MSAFTAAPRAILARLRSRAASAAASPRTARRALAVVGSAVALSLSLVSGTTALWTGSGSVTAPRITAGSIKAELAGWTGLGHSFTSNALNKTAYLRVKNSGSVGADFTMTTSMGAGSDATMAANTYVIFWLTSDPANCTETAYVGSTYWVYTWSTVPKLSGTIAAGASGVFCFRTRLHADQLNTTASITPVMDFKLTVRNTQWTSAASTSVTQSVTADRASGNDYTDTVLSDGAARYWRLGESGGQVLYDWAGIDDAFAGTGTTRQVEGALLGDTNTSTTFSGSSTGTSGTRWTIAAPKTFAVEAWFKTTSTTGGKIVGFGNASAGSSTSYDRHLYMDGAGKVSFGVWPNTSKVITTSGSYNDGKWHYVVGNLSAAGQELYVDGVRIGLDTTTTSTVDYNGYWRIGGDSPWAGDAYFDGTIDEVAVYPAPLSASVIGDHWTLSGRGSSPAGVGDPYGSTVYGDSPTLYWRLGESTGTIAGDSSPNGYSGGYSGDVTRPVPGAVVGTRNPAASFASPDGLVASAAQFTNPQDYSLELWFKTTTTTGGKLIGFGNAQTGSSTSYDRHIYLQDDGRLTYGIYAGSTQTVTTPSAYNDGAWHQVVATQSADGMRLYVDGRLAGSGPATGAENFAGYWRVGGDNLTGWPNAPTTPHVTADIDEVSVYGSALSAEKVKRHYSVGSGTPTASFTSTVSGLTAAFDASASVDYNGSLTGYSWNFGDGTPAETGAKPTHTYAAPGTYTVTLTATDDSGKTDTSTASVTATDVTAPSAPGTPTSSGNTGTTVSLSWPASTDDVGVSGYEVYRDGTLIATVTQTSYTDTGLSVGTTYGYAVTALDGSGNVSASSPTLSVSTHVVDTAVWYSAKNLVSGKCVTAAGTTSPSALQQYGCASPAGTDQAFRFVPTSDGYFTIESRAASTIAWDVSGASLDENAQVVLYTSHGGTNQQWKPERQPDNGSYSFVNRNSGKCAQFAGGSTADGSQLQQATCAVTDSQRFELAVAP